MEIGLCATLVRIDSDNVDKDFDDHYKNDDVGDKDYSWFVHLWSTKFQDFPGAHVTKIKVWNT